MDCLVRRKDNTVAYINKLHNYNPKGTPRPSYKTKKNIDKMTDNELLKLISLLSI